MISWNWTSPAFTNKHGRSFNKNNLVGFIQMQENQNHNKSCEEQGKS